MEKGIDDIKTTWGNSLMQLGFMELNGKARDRRGNEICSSKVRRVAQRPIREQEKREREREGVKDRGWSV